MARAGLATWQAADALAARTHQTARMVNRGRYRTVFSAASRAVSLGVLGGVLMAALTGAEVRGAPGQWAAPPAAATHGGLPAGRPCQQRQSRIQPDDFSKGPKT